MVGRDSTIPCSSRTSHHSHFSFGGFVAQSYAIRHPNHPAKLIFHSTAPVLQDEPVLDGFEALGGKDARAFAERYFAARTEATTAECRRGSLPGPID